MSALLLLFSKNKNSKGTLMASVDHGFYKSQPSSPIGTDDRCYNTWITKMRLRIDHVCDFPKFRLAGICAERRVALLEMGSNTTNGYWGIWSIYTFSKSEISPTHIWPYGELKMPGGLCICAFLHFKRKQTKFMCFFHVKGPVDQAIWVSGLGTSKSIQFGCMSWVGCGRQRWKGLQSLSMSAFEKYADADYMSGARSILVYIANQPWPNYARHQPWLEHQASAKFVSALHMHEVI